MQFREVGKKIQVIRAAYSSEAKRAVATMVFSVPRWSAFHMTDEQRKKLTDGEAKEVTDYFQRRRDESAELDRRALVKYAPTTLLSLARGIRACAEAGTMPDSATWGGETWAALDAISKALRSAKVQRPKAKAAETAPPEQGTLV